jgi:hypothetical protein
VVAGQAATWCAGGQVREEKDAEVGRLLLARHLTYTKPGFVNRKTLADLHLAFERLLDLFVPVHMSDMGKTTEVMMILTER